MLSFVCDVLVLLCAVYQVSLSQTDLLSSADVLPELEHLSSCPVQRLRSGEISALKVKNAVFGADTREYYVYVPQSYDNSKPVALLLLWHGLNDECQRFLKVTGFMPFADKENFVIVSMCGSDGLLGVGFNAGMCCGFGAFSKTDDLAFGRWVVANVSQQLCINSEEVFVTGFSNGAFMTEILGCNASSIFRAGASVSGVVELRPGNDRGLKNCDKQYAAAGENAFSTSILNVHGTRDALVPWTGDALLGFPPIPKNMQRWAERNGCKGNYSVTFQNEHYSNQLWTECAANSEIELVIHYKGEHEWPRDEWFNTTDYIMDFFRRNGLNSGKPRHI